VRKKAPEFEARGGLTGILKFRFIEIRLAVGEPYMGHSVTVELPDDLYNPLATKARESGRTVEELAVDCIAGEILGPVHPLEKLIGTLDSQDFKIGGDIDALLGDEIARRKGIIVKEGVPVQLINPFESESKEA
jgi:hypothetical protein